MIAIVDYGRGNLGSVEKAFGRIGIPAVVTQEAQVVDEADAVVLPGDGAFHDAMANLNTLGLLSPLRRALTRGRPFLGICLGYQLLFTSSEEFGEGRGLDVVPGVVRRFPPGRKVPHMGWNRVLHAGDLRLFDGIPDGAHFYFVHSYYPVVASTVVAGSASPEFVVAGTASTEQPKVGCIEKDSGSGRAITTSSSGRPVSPPELKLAWCEYGVRFAAAIERGSLYATQFHPEKSQRWGLRLLENFAAIVQDGGR